MNLSLLDVEGSALVVSQFTLHARVKKGTRPSFDKAAKPDQAIPLYENCIEVTGPEPRSDGGGVGRESSSNGSVRGHDERQPGQ